MLDMKRREFITLIGGAAVAGPLAARAQQHKGPVRLGFLPIGSPRSTYDRSLVEAFQQGLRQVGLIENQNIVLDVVWVGDDPDQAVSEELQRGADSAQKSRPIDPVFRADSVVLAISVEKDGNYVTGGHRQAMLARSTL